jgi:hypothetical protein
MKLKTNKITFKAKNKFEAEVCLQPAPASKVLPNWWRSATPYIIAENNQEGKTFICENGQGNATFKKCQPMLDALTSGYIISLMVDVQIRQVDNQPRITWRSRRISPFDLIPANAALIEPPVGFDSTLFRFLNTWIPITPKGYSVFITQPYGFNNSPFQLVPSIVDSDRSQLELAPALWIEKGFEGIVEKGTPIMQITPFKREEWEMNIDNYEGDEYIILGEKNFGSTLKNNYVKNHWNKKSYK